ncbi:MAG: hypothetical protein AAB703_03270, partial [Pseudomonadota bacterium]
SPSRDFESRASTNSAIPATLFVCFLNKQQTQLSLKTGSTASRMGENMLYPYNRRHENPGF